MGSHGGSGMGGERGGWRREVPRGVLGLGVLVLIGVSAFGAAPRPGDPRRGAEAFGQCAACHSVEPGQHLTGPSLARVWGRRAGTVEGFGRYSEALRRAGLVWSPETLDRWLEDPVALVPGTTMTIPGVKDPRERADLLAYLQAVSEGRAPRPPAGGMMAAGPRMKLRELDKAYRVRAIRYCGDAYHVTTEAGDTFPIWEFNLRIKTDSGPDGPARGHPVLIRAGMMGDRAFLVFAAPEEISAAIERKC